MPESETKGRLTINFLERKHVFDWFEKFYTYTNGWIAIAAQRARFPECKSRRR